MPVLCIGYRTGDWYSYITHSRPAVKKQSYDRLKSPGSEIRIVGSKLPDSCKNSLIAVLKGGRAKISMGWVRTRTRGLSSGRQTLRDQQSHHRLSMSSEQCSRGDRPLTKAVYLYKDYRIPTRLVYYTTSCTIIKVQYTCHVMQSCFVLRRWKVIRSNCTFDYSMPS